MTQDYTALAIAAGFALAGLLPLIIRDSLRPVTWLCLLSGAAAGFFAREAMTLTWELLTRPAGWHPLVAAFLKGFLYSSPAGTMIQAVVASGMGELLKAIAPLAVIIFASTSARVGLSFGAAAGAGFGFITAYGVLVQVLELAGSPIVTRLSTALAIAGQFFAILAHTGTTALVAWAAATGEFGTTFLIVWVVQFLLTLAWRLPVVSGIPVALPILMVVSMWLVLAAWKLRRRGSPGTVRTTARATSASEP